MFHADFCSNSRKAFVSMKARTHSLYDQVLGLCNRRARQVISGSTEYYVYGLRGRKPLRHLRLLITYFMLCRVEHQRASCVHNFGVSSFCNNNFSSHSRSCIRNRQLGHGSSGPLTLHKRSGAVRFLHRCRYC